MENRRPVMLVGGAGCGKTVLVNDKLAGEGSVCVCVCVCGGLVRSMCVCLEGW